MQTRALFISIDATNARVGFCKWSQTFAQNFLRHLGPRTDYTNVGSSDRDCPDRRAVILPRSPPGYNPRQNMQTFHYSGSPIQIKAMFAQPKLSVRVSGQLTLRAWGQGRQRYFLYSGNVG